MADDFVADQPPLPCLVLGMHRSSTSFVAGWLNQLPIKLGKDLLDASIGNDFGHYEDLDFLAFHRRLLKQNGCHYLVTGDQLSYNQRDVDEAQKIVKARETQGVAWGWKDPRTCLYLDLWRSVLGSFNGFCLYRNCDAVIGSILRRNDKEQLAFSRLPIHKKLVRGIKNRVDVFQTSDSMQARWNANRIATSWVRHNREIIRHIELDPDSQRWLLFSLPNLLKKWENIISYMRSSWSYPISGINPNLSFQENSFETRFEAFNLPIDLTNQIVELEKELAHYENISLNKIL